jgi:hypothetical protein
MAIKLLFGNTTVSPRSQNGSNYHVLEYFESTLDAIATEIRMYANDDANVKATAYEGIGSPIDATASLIWSDLTGTAFIGGTWNTFNVTISITNGKRYYIGADSDTVGGTSYVEDAGGRFYKSETYSGFSPPNPLGTGFITKFNSKNLYAVYGYTPPIISSISDSLVYDGQTGVSISGSDFMASGATLEICDGPVYSTANKISQTITNQTDSDIEFTVVNTVPFYGDCYLFVTTSLGQRNSTGYKLGFPYEFKGTLKKTMVFNRILNAHEIKSLYNRSRIG